MTQVNTNHRKIVSHVRRIEEVVEQLGLDTPHSVRDFSTAKGTMDKHLRKVDALGGLDGLPDEDRQWAQGVADEAKTIVRFELAISTEGIVGTMAAQITAGKALMAFAQTKFRNKPEIATLLQVGGNIWHRHERRLDKWYLCEVALQPALLFRQAIEEGLKCLIYNYRQTEPPGQQDGHELEKLLDTLRKVNPTCTKAIEAEHKRQFRGTSLWSQERATVRNILRLNKGLYRDGRYSAQVWQHRRLDGRGTVGKPIREPEELGMAASTVFAVVGNLYREEHLEYTTRLGPPRNADTQANNDA